MKYEELLLFLVFAPMTTLCWGLFGLLGSISSGIIFGLVSLGKWLVISYFPMKKC
jgi:hypothetical protein